MEGTAPSASSALGSIASLSGRLLLAATSGSEAARNHSRHQEPASFGMDGAVRYEGLVRCWRAGRRQMPTCRWTENGKTYLLPQL